MVGRPGQYQFSFNNGELAPAVWGNTGLKQYYGGLAQALNIEPVPQGGFRLLPRSRYRAVLPRALDPNTGIPAACLFQFGLSNTSPYVIAITPGLATVFKNGLQVQTFAVPYLAVDIATLQMVQRFDTMLLFHQNYAIGRILNNGSDAAWTYDQPPFTNIPQVQYSGTYTNTPEVWTVNIDWTSGSDPNGVGFVIDVNGQETGLLLFSTTVDMSYAIGTALAALPNVDAGCLVSQADNPNSIYMTITFTGGLNNGANFIVGGRITTGQQFIALSTWRDTVGKVAGESMFSGPRGYPGCGTFYQDRLAMGGLRSKTSSFALSRTGEYYDLNILLTGVPSGALLLNLSTDGAESIVAMAQSKHLVIFTTEADYYVSDRAITATAAPAVVQSSTNGCSARVPVVKQEAGLIYVNKDETLLIAAAYDAVNDAYVSQPLSLLSSHIVEHIRDSALQRAYLATDSQRCWLPRDDGVCVVALMIRNQDICAFVRWQTDGQVRAVAVDGANTVHMLVDRLVGGVEKLCLETIEDGLLVDSAVTITNGSPQTAITGLSALEGATVFALADGYTEGPFTVTGGTIHIQYASLVVTVGRWTAPMAETLPLVRDVTAHTVLQRPCRVFQVVLDLIGTTSLAVGANGLPARNVPLYQAGAPTDQPLAPVTDKRTVSGLVGWSQDGQVTITQTMPGALQVRDIIVEAKI